MRTPLPDAARVGGLPSDHARPRVARAVVRLIALWIAALPVVAFAAAAEDPLARPRVLYNERKFDEAITAADQARLLPGRADSADLVAARAFLERYRASAVPEDLTTARERLRRLDPQRLQPRERVEYIVGLGETLYFDQS